MLMPVLAYADNDFMTGNKLFSQIESSNSNERAFAKGYISGFVEGIIGSNVLLNSKVITCVPEGVTYTQLRDIIHDYLKKEPKERHKAAPFLIMASIHESYPCVVN